MEQKTIQDVSNKEGNITHRTHKKQREENIGTPYRRPKATHDTSNTKKKQTYATSHSLDNSLWHVARMGEGKVVHGVLVGIFLYSLALIWF
jgi:hypothetical protein